MSDRVCSNCGSAIDTDRPEGLCPACLLKEGLAEKTIHVDGASCERCGHSMGSRARFCDQCGAPAAVVSSQEDAIREALEAKLGGEYKIVRLLGRGGMGAVYLAKDLTLEREVAIKVISEVSNDRAAYDRFRREAKTAARLSHPNIVPLHSFGEVDGMPYFVMGYVRGESLAARLQREGTMPEEEGLEVVAEIADALDHAHRQGIVHRDIKPDNVLLEDESGRALLTDFGVAKATGRGETMTSVGTIVGTPQYMSPEQAEGRIDIDGRTDIYSLGVMAYAILGGRLPFEGSTAADILRKHLTQEPPSLRSFNPELSQGTARSLERCLEKDRDKRWADARSLRLALNVGEDERLPDALQGIEGRGFVMVAILIGGMIVVAVINILSHPNLTTVDLLAPPITMVLGSLLIYLFFLYRMRKEGFSVAQSQAAFWREPAWWLWWYPRHWRRKGNVWDRLPAAVRTLRWVQPASLVVPMSIVAVWLFSLSPLFESDRPMNIAVIGTIIVLVLVWIIASRKARRLVSEKGIEGYEAGRLINSMPPSRVSFWRRPHIAEVLLPEPGRETERDASPQHHLQAILRYGKELPSPYRALGGEAAVAARQLLSSIEALDREIGSLAKSIEHGEEERIEAKIGALDEEAGPLRSILEKELDLIRGLSERMEELKEIRGRRMETIRSLSLHLASLRARAAESEETDSVTDRVRALCDEIASHSATQRV